MTRLEMKSLRKPDGRQETTWHNTGCMTRPMIGRFGFFIVSIYLYSWDMDDASKWGAPHTLHRCAQADEKINRHPKFAAIKKIEKIKVSIRRESTQTQRDYFLYLYVVTIDKKTELKFMVLTNN
jgi:hypothetical protein